jgi:hypothetical protein
MAVPVVALLASLGAASPASAGLQQEFAVFSDCPVNNPAVTTCIVSTTTSGEFVIGNKTVPVSKPVILQGGLTQANHLLVGAEDGNTLSKTALPVPGGIVGIELLPPLTEVTATAELAGSVEMNPNNLGNGQGTVASLPLKVKLDNPALGAACYIGSNSEPLTPNLTTGTTNPPPPNKPITGAPGTPKFVGNGKILVVSNSSLVDNAFAVPGANGCAGILSLLVDPAVDLQVGLPAAAGRNTAILNGSLAAASASSVKADAVLPELGRCVKQEPEKQGKTVVFHGGYVDAGCIETTPLHNGKYEWFPGPGAGKRFTGTSGAASLETVGKAKLTCSGSASEGEYTGTKSATVEIKLKGCKLAATKEVCQSAGAAAGEIVGKGLQAQLGFVKDEVVGNELIVSVGWDLKHEPSIVSAECGNAKQALVVTGSVIGPIGPIDKMVTANTLKFSATAGKQAPERFEGGPTDTLSVALGAQPAEQAGLTVTEKVTNEEKLEIKAEAEGE